MSVDMKQSLIDKSFDYCLELAKKHYENFPVASRLLPKAKRKYIAAIYAFARAADDFADEDGIEGGAVKRLALLDEWNEKLNDSYDGKAYDPIFIALGETVRECKIPKYLPESLLNAFRQDIVKNRYRNFDEVLKYCSNSANPVGRLVLLIYGYDDHELFSYSDKICTALQLVNFWQDVELDIKKDRVYLPEDDIKKFGYSYELLFEYKFDQTFRDLMEYEVNRTVELFNEGSRLLDLLKDKGAPVMLRKELKLTVLGGLKIASMIKALDYDVLHQRPALGFFDKFSLLLKVIF